MKIGSGDLRAIPQGIMFSFFYLATRGPSLFSNPNAKLAVLGIIRGHIGMKLGRIGPWP